MQGLSHGGFLSGWLVATPVWCGAWRMLHMTRAKISHYEWRGDQIRTSLWTNRTSQQDLLLHYEAVGPG